MSEDYAGYVYILSNKAMPGIVKIGRSIHGGRTRAKDLYKKGGTGVPVPFKMEFEEGKTKKGIYQVTDLMDGSIKWLG